MNVLCDTMRKGFKYVCFLLRKVVTVLCPYWRNLCYWLYNKVKKRMLHLLFGFINYLGKMELIFAMF